MSDLTLKFRACSENLCQILELEGLIVRPYQQSSLPFFQSLDSSEQQQALHLIENYYAICQSVRHHGGSLREGQALLETALKHFNLQAPSEVFEFIAPKNVYEFYSANQTQFFRTANFFEYTSYTIEDIYSRSWVHLYDRDPEITQKIFTYAAEIFSGANQSVIKPDLPEHVMTERASLEKLISPVRFECLAPLTQEGRTVGLLSVIRSSGKFLN